MKACAICSFDTILIIVEDIKVGWVCFSLCVLIMGILQSLSVQKRV